MKRFLSDALAGIVLALLAAIALFTLAGTAEAQVNDPPPACSPWATGKGITIAQMGNVYAATWWCPVNGAWLEQRAAAILQPYLERGAQESARRQALVDTPEEYFRLETFQARCGPRESMHEPRT